MKRIVGIIFIAITASSCLKKIEEVESANTNIFDEEYAGGKWFVYEDVFLYTNSNNDQVLRVVFSVPEEYAPKLKPTEIPLTISINEGPEIVTAAAIQTDGNYEGRVDVAPQAATNYCIRLGVYVEEQEKTINDFEDCKDL